MNRWRARDPVMRFQNLMLASDWWDAEKEKQLRVDLRKEVNDCSEPSLALCLCPCAGHGCCCIQANKWPPFSPSILAQAKGKLWLTMSFSWIMPGGIGVSFSFYNVDSMCVQVLRALDAAQKEPKAPLSDMFTDGNDHCMHDSLLQCCCSKSWTTSCGQSSFVQGLSSRL